ncbi:MAG: glycosyltransferase [Candidatus Roizmanbacteria bacterium]|nr:MAG: glycosyltransferase [Candidatus Roizmanbacteria bacterium]
MSKLIDKYNSPDSLIIVSLYPKKGEIYSVETSGVASYTKNVVKNIDKKSVIFANYINKKQEVYEEDHSLILRCFKTNHPFMWINLLINIFKFNKIKKILVQFDFAIYGNVLTSSLILLFLGILRLFGYQSSIVIHHVITDINKLSGHVGLGNARTDKTKAILFNIFFRCFYLILGFVANQIIVLEETLKYKLKSIAPYSNVTAISHGVDTNLSSPLKSLARKRLGIKKNEKIVLFFGFINWFKGADFFVDVFNKKNNILDKKTRCIIAGGISPTLKNKGYYQKYFAKVISSISTSPKIEITGCVPQRKIGYYFAAADVVVFPYRHFMTASGVLSLVFSYKKPFIVSNELSEMFNAFDLQNALQLSGLEQKDYIFKLNKQSLLVKLKKVLDNGVKKKMIRMAEIVREKRSYKNTALLYEQAIFNPNSYRLKDKLLFSYNKLYER